MPLSQESRLIRLDASFIKGDAQASNLSISEAISAPFNGQVSLLSENLTLTSKDVIGQSISIAVHYQGDDSPRYFHARINALKLGDLDGEVRHYNLSLVPGLWFLSQASHHRIFNNMTSLDIIEDVFRSYGDFCQFEQKIKSTYLQREYCVQFGETDFEFVNRLMAEEGISYYFVFKEKEHTLVLTDDTSGYTDCEQKSIYYSAGGTEASGEANITSWERTLQFHSNTFLMQDYNHDTPKNFYKQSISTNNKFAQQPAEKTMEGFGAFGFTSKSEGVHDFDVNYNKLIAQRRVESLEAQHDVAHAQSDAASLQAGGRFSLEHPAKSEEQTYIVTRIEHRASDGNDIGSSYENSFECIPSAVPPRPQCAYSKQVMHGPLTAKVVELAASESKVSADPHRMIKVEFPWDTKNKSCWLRVVQSYAGAGWGGSFVPRLNQEVLVEFIGGDPDRPLVVGALYNKDNQGPEYSSTQSGLKTASDKFNELRFDDKKGEEEIYVEAGKNYNFLIHNDESGEIENDQILTVKKNRTLTVAEGDETKTVKKGNQTLDVGGDRTSTVKGNQKETIKGDATDAVNGDHKQSVKGKQTLSVTGDQSLSIKGAQKVSVVGAIKHDSKGSIDLKAVQSIKMSANMSIELKVGANSIKLDPSGVSISGTMVKINGSAMTEVKAGGMLTLKGGITMIN
jgi:type VI secretion system secreted protein VgrG